MATIHDFSKHKPRRSDDRKQEIVTFYSIPVNKEDGTHMHIFPVPVKDGDHAALISRIIENKGIWNAEGTVFIPWPCALVTVEEDKNNIAGDYDWKDYF